MTVYKLEPLQELRIRVGNEPLKLELRCGLAEVYGTEMLVNRTYTIPRNSRAAVFTYHGATIESVGTPLKCHVGQKCDYMISYFNIHKRLESMRIEAERQENQDLSKTPICLVCKPMYARNVGKSTLCRILLNYAIKRGRAPIFVDLDPTQGQIGLPGSIGALSVEHPIDIETGLSLDSSMVLHFGHTDPAPESEDKDGLLYKFLLENMAKIVHSKLTNEHNWKSYCSGVIINTSANMSEDVGHKILVHACKVFRANVVLVMDDEVLQDDIKKDLFEIPDLQTEVINVPRTVGIVISDAGVEARLIKIKEYFYGTPNEIYHPMTIEMRFSFLKRLIFRVEIHVTLPGCVPLGTKAQENQIQVSQYDTCKASDLQNHILAISYCRIDDVLEDSDIVLRTNIKSFICITDVRGDGDQCVVSILSPDRLPSHLDHVLLYSDVLYMDSLFN